MFGKISQSPCSAKVKSRLCLDELWSFFQRSTVYFRSSKEAKHNSGFLSVDKLTFLEGIKWRLIPTQL